MNTYLLNTLGKRYVIESCIALFKKDMEEKYYKIYISEVLRTLTNNFVDALGGSRILVSLDDFIHPKQSQEFSAKEIIDRIKNGLNSVLEE